MTAEQRAVMVAAIEVAIAAPDRPNRYAFAAKVPWRRIDELRAALKAAGVDWEQVKAEQARIDAGDDEEDDDDRPTEDPPGDGRTHPSAAA